MMTKIIQVKQHSLEVKGACSNPQFHHPTFFKHMKILVHEVEPYLEGFIYKVTCAKSV